MNSFLILAIILIAIAFVLQYCYNGIEKTRRFTVYGSMKCGYTVKMLQYLKNSAESVRFVDVNTFTGDAEFKRITKGKNIRGVPYTIDHKTNKNIRGFQEINL